MIEDVVPQLSCPHCATALALTGGRMTCETGHAFDVARQGYVSLLRGDHRSGTADTAAMVEARTTFLAEGHYAGIAALIAGLGAPVLDGRSPETCVVDLGAGPGYYLARVLDAVGPGTSADSGGFAGVALDASKYAARRAVRAHPRIGAVVADAWQSLPIRGRAASLVLNVFAPRNPSEMRRILHPDGRAIVVVPEPGHLGELIAAHGLMSVDGRKRERIAAQFEGRFEIESEHGYRAARTLSAAQAEAVIAMGPNAWHVASGRVVGADPIEVTLDVRAYVLKPRCDR